jgi:hypothetical protein
MLYIGVDPGKKGAVYTIDSETGAIEHKDFDKASDFCLYLFLLKRKIRNPDYICGIEQVNSRPEDGVKQAFSFGGHVRRIKTLLNVCGVKYKEINPMRWMNFIGWGRLPRGKQNYEARKKELYKIASEMTDYEGLNKENSDAYLITKYLEMTKGGK